jgi:hypothetical protein
LRLSARADEYAAAASSAILASNDNVSTLFMVRFLGQTTAPSFR